MMTPENFIPDPNNPEILEQNCVACGLPIPVESEYVEVFVEKFYADLDEWFPLHRMCYERGLQMSIEMVGS